MLKVFTDAATKGNPGPSSGGMLVVGENLHLQKSFALPDSSNHEAEFAAVLWSLNYLVAENLHHQTLMLYTDSQVVAETIDNGASKNPLFQTFLKEILPLLDLFPIAVVQWIPEKKNKGAHHLAIQGLHKKTQKDRNSHPKN